MLAFLGYFAITVVGWVAAVGVLGWYAARTYHVDIHYNDAGSADQIGVSRK